MTDFRRAWRAGAAAAAALAVASAAAADVEILGVEGVPATNVLAYLDLDEEPCDAPRLRVEQLYGSAPVRIRDSLQAFGYYEPTIQSELDVRRGVLARALHDRARRARAHPHVDLGLTGEAQARPPFVAALALARAALTDGAALDHGAYELLKRRLTDLAANAATPTRNSPRAALTSTPSSMPPTSHCSSTQARVMPSAAPSSRKTCLRSSSHPRTSRSSPASRTTRASSSTSTQRSPTAAFSARSTFGHCRPIPRRARFRSPSH